ncbi:MAG: glycosyltransferase family 4 protein [Bacteroidales bacterium]|jgi:glycosyltransferase involved in cell wall biosynthesis
MKKVLLITYYWPPCGGPSVQRTLKFARYLPEFGYLPYVITVDENKASYPVTDNSLMKEVPENIKVFRTDTSEPFKLYSKVTNKKDIPHSGFANDGKPGFIQKISRFIRGNMFIPDARKGWNKYAIAKAKELIQQETFSAILTSSPPHSTQLIGLQLKKETGLPWIADLRDPWTDIYYYKEMMHLGFAKRKDAGYEQTVLENADKILVVSDAIKRMFLSKSTKINPEKIHVIPNGYDEVDFEMPSSNPPANEFLITYTGTLAANYGIDNFIEVLAEIKNENWGVYFKLRFVGELAESLRVKITCSGIHFEAIDYVPHNESIKYILGSTILLLAIPRIANNEGILTGKLFEYLASRKSIVCIGPENGDAAKIIRECSAGETFDYEEKGKLKQYLQSLINSWKENHNLDRKNDLHFKYSRKQQAEELSRIIGNSQV